MGFRDSRLITIEIHWSAFFLRSPDATVTSHRWRMCLTITNILVSALNLSLFRRYIGNTKLCTYF